MSTAQAGIPVATQCCGAAALNGTKRFELLEVKAGSIRRSRKRSPMKRAEDVRQPPG